MQNQAGSTNHQLLSLGYWNVGASRHASASWENPTREISWSKGGMGTYSPSEILWCSTDVDTTRQHLSLHLGCFSADPAVQLMPHSYLWLASFSTCGKEEVYTGLEERWNVDVGWYGGQQGISKSQPAVRALWQCSFLKDPRFWHQYNMPWVAEGDKVYSIQWVLFAQFSFSVFYFTPTHWHTWLCAFSSLLTALSLLPFIPPCVYCIREHMIRAITRRCINLTK